jgi:hypothetical protein
MTQSYISASHQDLRHFCLQQGLTNLELECKIPCNFLFMEDFWRAKPLWQSKTEGLDFALADTHFTNDGLRRGSL